MKTKKLSTQSKTSLKNKKILEIPESKLIEKILNDPTADLSSIKVKFKVKKDEIGAPVKVKIKPKEKVHYVNSKEFEEEITEYYKTGFVTHKLGDSLNKIANGLSFSPNFINYSFKDDMIGDAIVKMFAALKGQKFRLNTGFSPFSYFTTIAFHAFINRIKKEKKHHEAITEYREKMYTETMTQKDDNGKSYNIYVGPNHNYSEED